MVSPQTQLSERELAHKLLIELLSYQFAFPVRWIETQDELFTAADVRRLVEVGPAKILSTMAQKTWNKKFSQKDTLRATDRTFLSLADDASRLYYEYDGGEDFSKSAAPAVESASSAASTPAPTPAAAPPVAAPVAQAAPIPAAGPAAAVQDVPLRAFDIVIALAAQKLKKPFDELPMDKSIRDLCAGKSTLQNELVGDLGAEFGSLPDGCEDMTLEAIGAAVENNFSGAPGKQMGNLISRMVSSKMPGGFNAAAMKEHLEAHWGLGAQRQQAVIGFAVTAEPAQRIPSIDAAKAFLDGVTTRYASFAKVSLTPGGAASAIGGAQANLMIDAASLGHLSKQQEDYLRKQYELLASHLGIGVGLSNKQLDELEEVREALLTRLQRWGEEFDEDFFNGIQPAFDAKKERRYNSAWNWVREDLLKLFYGGGKDFGDESKLQHILNRWDSSCAAIATHFAAAEVGPKDLTAQVGQKLLERASGTTVRKPVYKYLSPPIAPKTTIDAAGIIKYEEVPRVMMGKKFETYHQLIQSGVVDPTTGEKLPYVHLCKRQGNDWKFDASSSAEFLDVLAEGTSTGLSFTGKTALVTGAGPGSIGSEIVRGLIAGGARVIITTSRPPAATADFYNSMYREHGASGSDLVVLQFNQGSIKDCQSLIEHIYSTPSYGGDLDFIVPFAAISESGQELDKINGKSELAHRVMLINLLRVLGHVKQQKEQRGFETRPTNVVLPLSPNHGTFGGDGLYAESKLGLETLFNRFHSENWSNYLTICGAVIGWTRGTGLMSGNNIVAEAVESHNCITFSQSEMAFNILALMSTSISQMCEEEPIYADLNGGVQFVSDLKGTLTSARKSILDESRLKKALVAERKHHEAALDAPAQGSTAQVVVPAPNPRATIKFSYPNLPAYETLIAGTSNLQDMIDLSRTVVVVGFSELGPWGSARTRWEIEQQGKLSWAGCVEMAWIMGLVKFFEGDLKGKFYVGWVDAKTNEPVQDIDFEKKYGEHIHKHAGIRNIEPEGLNGYDPAKKEFLHEVIVEHDLPVFEASKTTAHAFKLKHGDNVDIWPVSGDSEEYKVQVKKGAHFLVPKATAFDRQVAGQLPKGWDAKRYGIPEDIISQTDPMTLYVLCCVNEALLSAGFRDPFEIWQHIHVSELANCVGTGAGSLLALRGVYRDRYLDKPVQNDILQESFGNAMDAWANMLLLASAGPIKSPTGTCATAVESLDIACEAIRSGQSKIAIVGGSDDLQEEMSFEFGNMKATASSEEELEKGRLPKEMSRPTASSRAGFVESAGCGVQILMNAELALQIGAPIHAIVAHTQMAGDKVGRSVPAPGQGVLTAAREDPRSASSPLLDLEYRRRNLQEDLCQIKQWRKDQLKRAISRKEPESIVRAIEATATRKVKATQNLWSNDLRSQDPGISPMKASLAVWGLTVDDIRIASFHGTSTKANDKNESDVINKQMSHLGRTIGNPVLVVCQKYLTGHPKGAAGAFMMNGCLQAIQSGVVPGNRNADNVDENLRVFQHLVYPSRNVQVSDISAFMLTSFGFGQKGGLVVGVAPKYLFAAVPEKTYEDYRVRAVERQSLASNKLAEGLIGMSLFQAKTSSPWKPEDESAVFLDPLARVVSGKTGVLTFDPTNLHPDADNGSESDPLDSGYNSGYNSDQEQPISLAAAAHKWAQEAAAVKGPSTSVGVDVESITAIDTSNEVFLDRNFTPAEQAYCKASADLNASIAGRWAAKEAVFKSLRVKSKGAGAAMKEIEILSQEGVPVVELHGEAKKAADVRQIKHVEVSITHSAETVMAIALASRVEDEGFAF